MLPVLFSLGPRPIYAYTVVLGGAMLLAVTWAAWRDRSYHDGTFDLILAALIAGLFGARLTHVLANATYYAERPVDMLLPFDGGLSFHGGLLAGLVAIALLTLIGTPGHPGSLKRLKVVAGFLVVPFCVGLAGGWLACLLRGCAYGRALPPPQRLYTPDWPDIFGVHAFRLPSQAAGIGLAVVLLLTASLWMRRPGLLLIVLGLGDFAIAATRGDLSIAWGPLLAVQWADLLVVLAGVVLEITSRRVDRSVLGS